MSNYVKLHNEAKDWLLEIVDGEVNKSKPKPISDPKASCKIAKVLWNLTKMLETYNKEKK